MTTGKGLSLVFAATLLCMPSAGYTEVSLSGAMRAVRADSFSAALELSSTRDPNPWLEVFRLEARAQAFLGLGDSIGAAQRAFSALRLISGGEAEGHPSEVRLIDLIALCGGPELAQLFISEDNSSRLRPSTLFLLARDCFEAGDTSESVRYISLAGKRGPRASDIRMLSELSAAGALDPRIVPIETIASLATSAISAGDLEISRLLIDLVRSTAQNAWLAEILDADLSASSGRRSRALARYRSVFRSDDCPVEGKKRALRNIAAMQYSMKRLREASESYRIYGLYYPDDPFAETATDRSARIEVAAGRLEAAVETWQRISDSGPATMTGKEAVLAMAVILERLGRAGEAYQLLEENLRNASGRLRAAYLYWIIRTCGDEQARSDHTLLLEGEAARSFYAIAIEEGPGFLNADDERGVKFMISAHEDSTRKMPSPRISQPVDHPSLGAFRYFTMEKMKAEAAECARGYATELERTERGSLLGTIYTEARKAGLENICLELAVSHPRIFSGRKDYPEYLYPLAYGSEIDTSSGEYDLPPELVLAVIREESRFDEEIISPAGACGLMQIMPSTGEWIGKKIGRTRIDMSDLRDPAFNIEAGCWYLRFLLERSDESIVAALAAYNAGHGRMGSWKKRCRPHEDPLAALELIGPSETRQYVRRVLDSMASYSRQMSGASR